LPLARQKQMGVIAKRPLANVDRRYSNKPDNSYHDLYWERLQRLDYDFCRSDPRQAVETALRFTIAVPGEDTAIVGTTKPGRWRENAEMLAASPLPADTFERLRARWRAVADKNWVGLI
jgi:aryl-alcohol dehydrogenase-like predicted oxidoreductase